MAPKRRGNSNAMSQSTLAFHGRGSNRVTKSSAASSHATSKAARKLSSSGSPTAALAKASPPAPSHPSDNEAPTTSNPPSPITHETHDEQEDHALTPLVRSKPAAKPAPPAQQRDEQDAARIPAAQIKRYWAGKEKARRARRVHQGDLPLHEKVLREWDISAQFGPCIGIDRTKRWHRARKLKLDPPMEVLAVLLREREAAAAKTNGGVGLGSVERAHVDELMQSRFVES